MGRRWFCLSAYLACMCHESALSWPRVVVLALGLALVAGGTGLGQAPTTKQPWTYLLLNDGTLIDDCPICGRPTILESMRGTFQLRLLESNSLFSRYAVENISFTAGSTRHYRVTGAGTFQIGGEVAVVQRMSLQVRIDDGFTNRLCYLTNAPAAPGRPWPMIDISLEPTNGTVTQQYSLRLAAAPVREIWFSTVSRFTAAAGPTTFVGSGDLLSTSGRIVKRNADLFTSVGAFPPSPDLGLDAVDILPGGEIAFSLVSDITSTTLGQLHHGDLLSTRGRILRRNQDLLAPFGVMPPTPEVGLDAVQVLESGEILFSIATDIFSERLGVTLRRGDLLSSNGRVERSQQKLVSRFHPPKPATADYGLDALHLWPGGEIWFSTEQGFQDAVLGPILEGDLLSDQGYIVFRNLELLNAFAPIEDPPSFGLDALYVVTDAIAPAPAPRLNIAADPTSRGARLTWKGQGRVFQVLRADAVTGPFEPLSAILPNLTFDDPGALTNRTQGFYGLHQW